MWVIIESVEKFFLKLLTFLEELYKIKTIKGKKEKSEVVQMTKMLETLGAVHTHTHTLTQVF